MAGYDLINEIGQKSRMLDAAIRELGVRGRAYAQSEKDYRVAMARKILEERDKGTPVTIISDICRGTRKLLKCGLSEIVQRWYTNLHLKQSTL